MALRQHIRGDDRVRRGVWVLAASTMACFGSQSVKWRCVGSDFGLPGMSADYHEWSLSEVVAGMADDPYSTQREADVAVELFAAGFDDAEEIGRGGFGVVYR